MHLPHYTQAVEAGAVAVLSSRPLPDALLPVVVVPGALATLPALASAFYEAPSRRMRTVGMVGSFGKTTTTWLARGMFEETGERCGLVGELKGVTARHLSPAGGGGAQGAQGDKGCWCSCGGGAEAKGSPLAAWREPVAACVAHTVLRCAGSIEYALAEDRLTEEGELWAPDAEDVTLQVRQHGNMET